MPSWAGGWDNAPVSPIPYAPLGEPTATPRGVARLMSAQGNLVFAAMTEALTGAVVGGPVTASYAQVSARQADGLNMGGAVPITNNVLINRTTTATDLALVDAQLKPTWAPNPYPVDKSGNSGGGFLGTVNK